MFRVEKTISMRELRWKELGKAAVVAIVAGAISFEVAKVVPIGTVGRGNRIADLVQLGLISITWAAAAAAGLWLLKSDLPRDLRRRRVAAYGAVAQGESKEILGGGREP